MIEDYLVKHYFFLGFLFLGSCTLGFCVRKTHPKNPPNDKLITPIKVIINEDSEDKLGAIVNPIIIPPIPVPKNIIIRTFNRKGLMYFIYKFFSIWQHYKLNAGFKRNFER